MKGNVKNFSYNLYLPCHNYPVSYKNRNKNRNRKIEFKKSPFQDSLIILSKFRELFIH